MWNRDANNSILACLSKLKYGKLTHYQETLTTRDSGMDSTKPMSSNSGEENYVIYNPIS